MTTFKGFAVLIFLFYNTLSNAVEMPSAIKICNRDDPKLNRCLKKSLRHFFPLAAEGIPELNMGPLDPYVDKEAHLELKLNQIVITTNLYNITVTGLSAIKIHDVRADIQDDSFQMEIDVSIKTFYAEGVFDVEGKLNSLVIHHSGYFNTTMENVTSTWKLKGSPVVKKGKEYIKISKFFVILDASDMKIHIPDIFPGNQDLSKFARDFVNSNWRILYKEILPFAEANWDKTGKKICSKIFGKIPFPELFPVTKDDGADVDDDVEIAAEN